MSAPPVNGQNPQQQLQELIERNVARIAALARSGVTVDPASVVHARIDVLTDAVAGVLGPSGPVWALAARHAFELRMAAELDRMEAEAGRIQLAQGAAWSPAMIAQLARETGTFQVRRAG